MLDDLDASLGRAVDAVRSEGGSSGVEGGGGGGGGVGGGGNGGDLLDMFERWRSELDRIRAGDRQIPSRAGSGSGVGVGAGGGVAGDGRAGMGVMRGRKGVRPEDDPSSAESGGMFVD